MRLRRARELAGLDLQQAASRLGMSVSELARFEGGSAGLVHNVPAPLLSPSAHDLERMCEVYGVNIWWLRGFDVALDDHAVRLLDSIEPPDDRARVAELLSSLRPPQSDRMGIYSDAYPGMKPGETRVVLVGEHRMSVRMNHASAVHTGRATYHVLCVTCDGEVVAESTTGPRQLAEHHARRVARGDSTSGGRTATPQKGS